MVRSSRHLGEFTHSNRTQGHGIPISKPLEALEHSSERQSTSSVSGACERTRWLRAFEEVAIAPDQVEVAIGQVIEHLRPLDPGVSDAIRVAGSRRAATQLSCDEPRAMTSAIGETIIELPK